jgi:hypothetical protein
MSLNHEIEQIAKSVEKSGELKGLNLGGIADVFSENLSNVFSKVSEGALKGLAQFPDSDRLLTDLFGDQLQSDLSKRAPEVALVLRPVEGLTDSDRNAVDSITEKMMSDNSEPQVRRNIETQLQSTGVERNRVLRQLERETSDSRSMSPWAIIVDSSGQNGYRVTRR